MKRKLCLAILLSLIMLSSAASLADGDTYVGGPWGTRITNLPCTISAPGSYYLAGNLSCSSADGINIKSSNVTLDLMGFALTVTNNAFSGIVLFGVHNVEIRNGTVSAGKYGILDNSGSANRYRIINLRVTGTQDAINLNGDGHLIQGCQATSTGSGSGIFMGGVATTRGCYVTYSTGFGIFANSGGTISGNVVIGSSTAGTGILAGGNASLVMGNMVLGFGNNGIFCGGAASVIGNTVNTPTSGSTGIAINDGTLPVVLDQNTVFGPGTHYSGAGSGTRPRNNAG
jgi:hypothetical protein